MGGLSMKIIEKPLTVNPLKKSQVLGAVTAFLGMNRCMPLVHGAQGCMAFTKNFLTQHFREITPMQSTAIFDVAAILGDDRNLHEGIMNVIEKQHPEMVGLVTTGLTETRGDDIKGGITRFRQKYPQYEKIPIVFVSAPDFKNDAETGYGKAVTEIIRAVADPELKKEYTPNKRVNILAGLNLNAADVDWLRRVFNEFGLDVTIIPDTASSMGGQVNRYYGLPEEGTSVSEIARSSTADFTIAIGKSMEYAADVLLEKCGVPYKLFNSLIGVNQTDELISWLIDYTGRNTPDWLKVERQRALDSMLDAHFNLSGRKCSIAAEPDLLFSLGNFISTELGVVIETAVTTIKSEPVDSLNTEHTICGDLGDLEEFTVGSDFIVGNSNALNVSKRLNKPLFRAGYPIKDMMGHFHRHFIGYRGTMELTFALGNICLELDIEKSHNIRRVI
jgi:nitrogenase molybdenum-iron cofactor biosynthesis protein NifN